MRTKTKVEEKQVRSRREKFHVVETVGKEQTVQNSNMPVMLTVRELSEKTHISCFSIRNMVKEDRIVYIKIGKKVLINYGKFLEYMQTGESGRKKG